MKCIVEYLDIKTHERKQITFTDVSEIAQDIAFPDKHVRIHNPYSQREGDIVYNFIRIEVFP